jgi:hypothetical protein
MTQLQYTPLINNLPLSYEQICDLETALVLAKVQLKTVNDADPDSLINQKIAKFDALYKHVSTFNQKGKWTKIEFPPEIERLLSNHKDLMEEKK